jgi:thiamine transport system substrate-binding protein
MKRHLIVAVTAALLAASCASSKQSEVSDGTNVTLITHDSFYVSDGLFDSFTKQTGITVTVAKGADAGVVLNQAILAAGKPEGDVLWGVDNTLLSRAVKNNVFVPYKSPGTTTADRAATSLVPNGEATPVDKGDVCVNVDTGWFAKAGKQPPTTIDDLVRPDYKGLLVVENPATSSPGLAFLLATIAKFGDTGWLGYWKQLKANGVLVVDGWTAAYQTEFTRAEGGTRPIVVSYGSSPVAELPADGGAAPTRALLDACFRQFEFAGVLRGTKHENAARKLIDFLLGDTFQADMAPNMYVYPIRADVALPATFTSAGGQADKPLTITPAAIETNREIWIKTWSDLMLS